MTREQCKDCEWFLAAEDNETGIDRCLLLRMSYKGTMRTRRIEDIEDCEK
jgi:hypothetical protein